MSKQLRSLIFLPAFVLLVAGVMALTRSAYAQAPTPTDDQVNAVARELYCPVCENTPLDVCPTEACRQWRELIRKQLGEGWTESQIKQYFVDNYGARVLSEPPRTGLNWMVYVLPPLLIVAGAFVLFRAMRSWTRSSSAASRPEEAAPVIPAAPEQDEYFSRLEEEVRKRK
jgi:cytochrome c-type biogenesis protein CcmH